MYVIKEICTSLRAIDLKVVPLAGRLHNDKWIPKFVQAVKKRLLRRIASGVADVTESHVHIKKRPGRNEAVKLNSGVRVLYLIPTWTYHNRVLSSL